MDPQLPSSLQQKEPQTRTVQSPYYRPLCQNASISGTIKLKGPVSVGEDVSVIMILKNVTDTAKTIQLNISVHSILYTKRSMNEFFKDTKSITFDPNEEKKIPLDIPYSSYEDVLTADNMIEVKVVCIGERKGDTAIIQRDIVLDNPKLSFKVSEKAVANKAVTVEVSFVNPLSKEVTNCVLRAEGSGLLKDEIVVKVENVKPKETVKIPVEITPYRPGNRQLLVDFTCNKFTNVKGYHMIDVESNGL